MTEEEKAIKKQMGLLEEISTTLKDMRKFFETLYKKGDLGQEDFVWITTEQLEKLTGVSGRTLKFWRDEGTIGFSRIGKKIFYNKREIEQILMQKFSRKVNL